MKNHAILDKIGLGIIGRLGNDMVKDLIKKKNDCEKDMLLASIFTCG
jgi:hypothetical protein